MLSEQQHSFDKKPQKTRARIMTDVRRMRDGGITSSTSPAMAWTQVWTWVMNLLPLTIQCALSDPD